MGEEGTIAVSGKLPMAGHYYRHYKGDIYKVVGIAEMHDTRRPYVVYYPVTGEHRQAEPNVSYTIRPLFKRSTADNLTMPDAWTDWAVVDGLTVRRFVPQ